MPLLLTASAAIQLAIDGRSAGALFSHTQKALVVTMHSVSVVIAVVSLAKLQKWEHIYTVTFV